MGDCSKECHRGTLFPGVIQMRTDIKCPQCHKPVTWLDNPDRPFCSERCRLLDLGQWVDESYRVAGRSQDALSEENVIHLSKQKQDVERS